MASLLRLALVRPGQTVRSSRTLPSLRALRALRKRHNGTRGFFCYSDVRFIRSSVFARPFLSPFQASAFLPPTSGSAGAVGCAPQLFYFVRRMLALLRGDSRILRTGHKSGKVLLRFYCVPPSPSPSSFPVLFLQLTLFSPHPPPYLQISLEGDSFELPSKTAKFSELIKTMLDDEQEPDAGDAPQEIPLPNVKAAVLAKVVAFLTHHSTVEPMSEIEKPLKSSNMSEVVQAFYSSFVSVEQELLFELILAANYMDIKPLLDLTCATVASMIKGKTPEEIRKTFNIVNDFTPEEEAQVREENKWCEEA